MKLRHFRHRVHYLPNGWFISQAVTPLGEPYAHAVHGSAVKRSYRWLFTFTRAARYVVRQLALEEDARRARRQP